MISSVSTLEWKGPATLEWIALHYFPTLEFIDSKNVEHMYMLFVT